MTKNESLGNSEILKNCPFCNSVALSWSRFGYLPQTIGHDETGFYIGCQNCKYHLRHPLSKSAVSKQWNQRATDEKLEECKKFFDQMVCVFRNNLDIQCGSAFDKSARKLLNELKEEVGE